MNWALVVIGVLTGVATFVGGLLALRLKGRVALILGLSGGAILGVAVLQLAPEALRGVSGPGLEIWWCIALGFLAYLAADRGLSALGWDVDHRAHIGPGSLAVHSLVDGLSIGLGFEASPAIGFSVAFAVIAHDLSDGANTVNLSIAGGSAPRIALRWLMVNAAAPVVGIGLALALAPPASVMPPILAVLAGGLIYLAIRTLGDERRRTHRLAWRLLGPLIGFGFIYGVTRLAGL